MKRIISFILALSMIFSLGITAFANVSYSADKEELKKGETVTVIINNGQKMEKITTFEYRLYFDSDFFELKSSQVGTALASTQISSERTDDKGTYYGVSFVDSTSAGVDVNEGVLYTFVFEAVKNIETAHVAEFELVKKSVMDTSWAEIDAGNISGKAISLTVSAAEVAVESVSLDKTSLSLEEGASETLTATVLPENATDKTVTWESSDKEVATVENGKVTAIKAGGATITAKAGEKEAKCEVTVTEKAVPAEPVVIYSGTDFPYSRYYVEKIIMSGAEVAYISGTDIYLDSKTAKDAQLSFEATAGGSSSGNLGINWNDNPTNTKTYAENLVDGKLTLKVYAYKASGAGVSRDGTKTFNFYIAEPNEIPVLADGYSSEATASVFSGESYNLNLGEVFTDADNDTLTYTVSVNGANAAAANAEYSYLNAVPGVYILKFTATDGKTAAEKQPTYTITLTVKNSETTYDVNVTIPEGVSPKFYAVNTVESGAVVKGDELVFENKTVKVPENISRIMWEAEGFVGMSAPVSANADLEIVNVAFDVKLDSGEKDNAAVEIKDSEGVKITGTSADKYLLPAVAGFTYKVTTSISGYNPAEFTEQTPASGTIETTLIQKHFIVVAPKGSVVSAGTLTGSFKYSFIEPIAVETEGETVTYKFAPLSNPSSGGAFVRVQHPDNDAVTYWDWKSSKADKQTITITEEMLFMNDSGEDKFDSDTVYRNFEKFAMDLGDIYMNINNQGYININAGDSKGLNMFRNWQAIESFTNAKISLPDFKYEIITLEGNDVISITPDKYNSAAATLTANNEGTAIVLVTYDAMYSDSTVKNSNGDAGDGNRYTAIWPDRTGVFVVSVGKDGTAIKSNMTCNGAVFDAEHSPQFYVGDEGASVSFIPEEGVTITVNRSTVGKETLSFGEFTSDGVSVNAETGEVTVSGLKTGRHIIKLEKDGVASYQVVTAQQVTVDIISSDGRNLGSNPTVAPGSKLVLKINGLTNPAEKFATKYNFNAQVTYKDEKGNAYKNSSGAAYGKYDFSSLEQIVNVTVPSDWDGETMTLNGFIQMGGFSGGAIGDHRKVSYGTASGMATGSGAGNTLATLPELVINVGTIPATNITLDKTSVRAEADEPFTLTATVEPANSTDIVEWISGDPTVATVENGVVTGQSAGTTTITAKVGDLTAVCTVEIYGTKKEIDIETTPTGTKYYLTDLKIKGVRGTVESAEGNVYNILLDPRTKTTDALDFVMTANKTQSSRYFWVNSSKLQTSLENPGTISLVPDWNENGEAVVTVKVANSGGGTNYDGPFTLNFKIIHEHICDQEVAEEKYLKSKATCTEEAVYYKSCVCGLASDSETFKYGEALGHDWADAEYKWAEDGSACTVTRTCKNDAAHTESAEATVTSEITKESTCTAKGETTYAAKFDVDWAAEQTKTLADVDIIAHVYDKEVAEEKYLKSEATCTEEAVYYKSCVCGLTSDSETFKYGEALGHDWADAEYEWAENGSACTATRICKNDATHTESAEATEIKSEVAKPATCVTEGDTQYTVTFAEDWAETQHKAITDIPVDKNAHEWGEWKVVKEASYTEEGTEKRVCNLSDEHFEEKAIEKLVPTATEKVETSEEGIEYIVAYQEGVVIVPKGLDVTAEDIKDALTDEVEDGSLKGEVVVTFMEATIGYFDDNNNFVPVESEDFFKDGKTIDIVLAYPEGADKNDNFEIYHYLDDGTIEKCTIKSRTEKGLVIEVGHLSPFAIAYESVSNTPNLPSRPSKPTDKPNPGITIIIPGDKVEESNPNTGAPVLCSFNLTAAGVVVLAATAAVLEIKRRK